MKKTITLIFLSLAPAFLAAAPISRAKARAIASQAFNRLNPSLSQPVDFNLEAKVKGRTLQADAESPAYYAFNNAGGNGFAIIAGDDLFPQMVAYSDKGQFTDEMEMAPALVEFLRAYAAYVEAVRNGEAEAPARRVPGDITGDVVVEPLLSTVWGQGSPYNYYCPNQWPVGCVATAMSQIMNYWKFPASGKGEITYGGSESMITVNFAESNYDWSIMKDKFAQLDWKRDAGKNVAKLCFDCGVACYMEYDETGSGATIVDAYNAFSQHFKYNAESITLLMREAMDSQEEWNDILFAELDARRPVLYAGASSSGGGPDAAGHAFVIDGYDSNHIVHVNWGWNGDNNGYYDITLLNPGGYTFSQRQEMVVGIIPDENEEHTQRKQFRMWMTDSLAAAKGTSAKLGSNFNLKIGAIYNHGTYAATYTIGINLYDVTGKLVQEISVPSDNLTVTLSSNYGKNPFGLVKCLVPADIPEGDYYCSVVSKEKGYDEYVLPYTSGGDKNNRMKFYIHDGVIDFYQHSTAINTIEAGEADVIRTDFFDISGRKISQPAQGIITIRRQILSNGTVKTTKIIK